MVGSTGGFPGHSLLVVSCCFFFVLVCDGYKVDLLGCAYEKLENLSYPHVIMVWLGEHLVFVDEYICNSGSVIINGLARWESCLFIGSPVFLYIL